MLDDLIAIGQEEKLVLKQMQGCLLMRHVDFDDGQVLHAVTRYCKVMQEGPRESLFDTPLQEDVEGGEDVAVEVEATEVCEIPQFLNKDISNFLSTRFC